MIFKANQPKSILFIAMLRFELQLELWQMARDDFAHIDIVISQSSRNLIKIDCKTLHSQPMADQR